MADPSCHETPDGSTAEPTPVDCETFRSRHSEYLDGELPPGDRERWREHALTCLPCARFDRMVRRSCELVHDLPSLRPSADFLPRLQHRIHYIDDQNRLSRLHRGRGRDVAVAVALAGVIAVLAWSPLLRPRPITVELPAVQARVPRAGWSPRLDANYYGAVGALRSDVTLPGVWLTGRPSASADFFAAGGLGVSAFGAGDYRDLLLRSLASSGPGEDPAGLIQAPAEGGRARE